LFFANASLLKERLRDTLRCMDPQWQVTSKDRRLAVSFPYLMERRAMTSQQPWSCEGAARALYEQFCEHGAPHPINISYCAFEPILGVFDLSPLAAAIAEAQGSRSDKRQPSATPGPRRCFAPMSVRSKHPWPSTSCGHRARAVRLLRFRGRARRPRSAQGEME